MTLILSLASHDGVFQVSDRLCICLTGRPFDDVANKCVLYVAPDAIVSMAYTGAAYVERVPTDQWLAGLISGTSLPPGPHPGSVTMFGIGNPTQWLPLSRTIQLIKERLTEAFGSSRMPNEAREAAFEVLIVGWHGIHRKRPRPITVTVGKPHGRCDFEISWGGQLPPKRALFGCIPESNLTPSERISFRSGVSKAKSADEAESFLVGAIRKVSHRLPWVGRDCMSVMIPPPGMKKIRVRYIPDKPRYLAVEPVSSGKVLGTLTATFTPWIVGPGQPLAASVTGGELKLGMGGIEITIEGPDQEPQPTDKKGIQLIDAGSGLRRKPDPS